MSQYNYSTKANAENMAKAVGRDLPISTKHAVEICNEIKGMSTEKAKKFLKDVLAEKIPVRFRRFPHGIGHRKGKFGTGRYPKKACEVFLTMIESVEANAEDKGLSVSDLVILHMRPQRAALQWHYGRQRRVSMKRSHLEVIVEEKKKEDKKTESKKVTKAETPAKSVQTEKIPEKKDKVE
jgi:large subunit ribosomal protein L22